jgi:hypothetical protein
MICQSEQSMTKKPGWSQSLAAACMSVADDTCLILPTCWELQVQVSECKLLGIAASAMAEYLLVVSLYGVTVTKQSIKINNAFPFLCQVLVPSRKQEGTDA